MARNKFVDIGRAGGKARAAKLSGAERSAIAKKAARARWHVLGGIHRVGVVPVARLVSGLRVGQPQATSIVQQEGAEIDANAAIATLLELRAEDVGPLGASATIRKCEGRWLGTPLEPTVECEVAFSPLPGIEPTPTAFRAHMESMAERAAGRLGQKVVMLWFGDELVLASGPGLPPPERV